MMKVKQIYIENFKGIHKRTVIELDPSQLTVLNGPNGFGKTTIFDVIELCLRGKLERSVSYSYVTKNNADYQKPFYQNRRDEDVVVKVWLVGPSANHIIIKRLNKDGNGRVENGRAFRPDSWQLLETYYTNDVAGFDIQPDYSQVQQIDQAFIDQLFYPDDEVSLVNLFPLFHYLQQEENIYFLKKDEEEKKKELNFLFQTQRQSDELEQVSTLARRLNDIKRSLAGRISELGQPYGTSEAIPYQQLISWQELSWDKVAPFADVPADRLNTIYDTYRIEITALINFSRTFDVAEFNKFRLRSELQRVLRSSWSLTSIIIQNFLSDENFAQLQKQYDLNRRYKTYREAVASYLMDASIVAEFEYGPSQIQLMTEAFARRQSLIEQRSSIGRIIQELNDARKRTWQKFFELNDDDHPHEPVNCPLCNAKWETMEELTAAIDNKTTIFEALLDAQAVSLEDLEKELTSAYIQPIQLAIENYLSMAEHAIENAFYAEVMERRGNLRATNDILALFEKNKIVVSDLQLFSYSTQTKVSEHVDLLRRRLQDLVTELIIDESRIENYALYTEMYAEDYRRIIAETELTQKLAYVAEKFNAAKSLSIGVLTRRLDAVSQMLGKIEAIRDSLGRAIFDYKKAMIEKIKIPFYIYSGKILQHFQQGYGIFVDVSSTTSRVRFLADQSSDHDIIHQLSTGQLAVVSIAFCLSLNKVYKMPSHFKFLAIDDPVQTLDDLNIYSLIELIRHEFDDYQLIISTHDENIANFLAYKFGKFNISNQKLNVQTAFYASQNV